MDNSISAVVEKGRLKKITFNDNALNADLT